ncbi:MAG: tetratricopeptide repeat protein [Anaerolineales bacterium]|nr:tetratricopeptide repeat protein [Anaerolineales bacterium]
MSEFEFWKDLGNIFDAVLNYQKKNVEFNNKFINPWIRLGNIFERQDQHKEAVQAYQHATEIDPGSAQNWMDLGDAQFKSAEYDQAASSYQKAIALDPNSGWAFSNLALVFVTQSRYEEAVPLYLNSIDLLSEPKDKAMSWNRLGNVYRKLNNYQEAFLAFQQADQLDGENTGFSDKLDEAPPAAETLIAPEEILEQVIVEQPLDESVEPSVTSEAVAEENQPEAVAEPVEEAVSESVEEAVAESAEEAVSESVEEAVAESVEEAVAESVEEAVAESVEEAVAESVEEAVAESVEEAVAESVEEAVAESVEEAVAESVEEAVAESVEEAVAESVEEAVAESVEEAVAESVEEAVAESVEEAVAESTEEAVAESAEEVVAESIEEAVAESVEEAVSESVEEESVEEAVSELAEEEPVEEEVKAPRRTVLELIEDVIAKVEAAVSPKKAEEAVSVEEVEEVAEDEVVEEVQAEASRAPAWLVLPDQAAPESAVTEETEEIETLSAAELENEVPLLEDSAVTISDVPQQSAVSESAVTMDVVETYTEPMLTVSEENVEAAEQAEVSLETLAEEVQSEEAINQELEAAYEEFLKDAEPTHILPDHVDELSEAPRAKVSADGEVQIAMDTKNPHVWNELGNVYLNAGSYDNAIAAYSKALELDRHFAWPYSNLAVAYVQKGRFAEAILLYQRGIELFTADKDKAITWNRLGNVYRRMNDYDNAIAAYQTADELDPENTTLPLRSNFGLLGNIYNEQKPAYIA